MRDREFSKTAEYMAFFRALESVQPFRSRLFQDRLASAFVGRKLRMALRVADIPLVGRLLPAFIDRRWPGARTSGVARTRFIDDIVESELNAGARQVVILGAGFDARAYRMAAMADAAVFEVDHPATSAEKRTRVQAALGAVPRHVRFVAVDFNKDSMADAIGAAGFDPTRRTIVVWEGVTNYLLKEAVDTTLDWCAALPRESVVVFTYVDQMVLDTPHAFEGTARLFATLGKSGERWTFGIDPALLPALLAQRGLALEQDAGAASYRARYYGRASVGMQGYEFYRVAVARVSRDVAALRTSR
jgi:methyltransferase (TIGR00027 family)